MLPEWRDTVPPDAFVYGIRIESTPLEDVEQGPREIADPSLGLSNKLWRSNYVEGQIVVSSEGSSSFYLPVTGVTRTALAFDQQGRIALGYQTDAGAFLYWYDAQVGGYTTKALASGVTKLCLHFDERSPALVSDSDIVMAYTREGNIYTLIQRERFNIEHLAGPGNLVSLGMTRGNRLQMQIA